MNKNKIPKWDKSITILVVEDNDVSSELIYHFLKVLNLSVYSVSNGQEAVDKLSKYSYDLIFMDNQMPVMNGIEATKIIRKKGIKTPIIAISSGENSSIYKKVGMNEYLGKPILFNNLYNVLLKYLGKPTKYEKSIENEDIELQFIIKISMIDITEAQPFFSLDKPKENYIKQLKYFKFKYRNFESEFFEEYRNKKYNVCLCMIHNLINHSGIIGAKQIYNLSKLLQKQFSANIIDNDTDKPIKELIKLMKLLLTELDKYLPILSAPTSTKRVTEEQLDELNRLLNDNDYKVYNFFENIESQLRQNFNNVKIDKLKNDISRYDFEGAIETIKYIL